MGDKKLNQLHIHLPNKNIGDFKAEDGWLSLSEARGVKVGIKEYEEELEQINREFEAQQKKVDGLKDEAAVKEIRLAQKGANDFLLESHERLKRGGITQLTHNANEAAWEEGKKERANKEKAITDRQAKALEPYAAQRDTKLKALKDKYQNVRWVCTSVRGGAPRLTSESFNEDWGKGDLNDCFNFSSFIEGGGFIYLEPFFEGDTPQGKPPYGLYISAKGTPKILGADWRDGIGNEISEDTKIAFGSTIYLNIYTKGLYGQNIKIALRDQNNWLRLGLRLPYLNKKLTVNLRAEGAGDAEELEIQAEKFTRGVDVHKVPKVPSTAITGFMVESGEDIRDEEWKRSERVQMCQFPIKIDHAWKDSGGDDLIIYPTVFYTGKKEEEEKEELHHSKLIISEASRNFYEVEKIESNQVAIYSNIETNIAHFNPCGYTKIISEYGLEGKDVTIFEQRSSAISKELKLQLIADDKPKLLSIKLEDQDSQECRQSGTEKAHTGRVITPIPETFIFNPNVFDDTLDDEVSYPKPSLEKAIEMAWLPNAKPLKYGVDFASCRFQQHLEVEVYPDLEYTFNLHLGVNEGEYLYVKQTKNYNKRNYQAKKKDGSKAVKKAHNKQIKKAYAENIDNKVTGSNFTKKYELSLGMEYSFGGAAPAKVELEGITTLKSIIETTLYLVEVIDSYLCGSKMKEAEGGAQFDDNGNKKEISPQQQINNKKEFEKKKKVRKAKKKEFGKGSLPLRFEVTPPKLTGGVTWSYANSIKTPELVGVNYQFKLGALPLIGFKGALDLLFCAQFIPYIGKAVKALDKAVATVNRAGSVLETLGIGSMEAEYYFDLVVSTELNINLTEGATYHSIDGFTAGNMQIDSPLEIKLEAGGNVRYQVFDIKGEAGIHAQATAKFKISYLAKNKKFLTFEFEGIEAVVTAKFKAEIIDTNGAGNERPEEQSEKDPDPIPILNGFSVDIPLFG